MSVEKNEVYFTDTISYGTTGGQDEDSITFEMSRYNVDEWIILNEEKIKRDIGLCWKGTTNYWRCSGDGYVISACKKRIGKILNSGNDLSDKNFLLVFCGKNISMEKLKKLL